MKITADIFSKLLLEIENRASEFFRCIVYMEVRNNQGENYLVKFSSCIDTDKDQIYIKDGVLFIEGLNELLYTISFDRNNEIPIAKHYEKCKFINSYTLLNIQINDPLNGKVSNNWEPPLKSQYSSKSSHFNSSAMSELEFKLITKEILQNEDGIGIFKIQYFDNDLKELKDALDDSTAFNPKLKELEVTGKIKNTYSGFGIVQLINDQSKDNSFQFVYHPVFLGPMMSWNTTQKENKIVTKIDFRIKE